MAELIDKSEAKEIMTEDWFLDILLTQYGRHEIKEEVENAIERIPTTTEAEIRAKAIDEFAEKLEAELLYAKMVLSERREMQERESEMAKMCSYNIGVLNAVGSMVGEIVEQLKEE